MLDVSVAYNRYKFLGHEFLTWLWYMIDTDFEALQKADPEMDALAIGNRIVLENHRHNRDETITIRGDGAGLEEGVMALTKGAKVTEMHLIFRAGELEWRFSVKGESLSISSLKTPQTAKLESAEDIEGAVLEKIYLVERVVKLVEQLYAQFAKQRFDPDWDKNVVHRIMDWIRQGPAAD
ncbi:MAG: hypothetical protein R6U41_08925 [Desulfosalsimonas sp.]|uniref:hypothetical protein n=1 Tax=Desulfosalsimonas sp. TaxID=3073848 RepID=UPI0039707FB0